MFLAFSLSDIVRVPFGYLISWLYQFTTNYGLALIIFGILVKVILLPATAKAKKSSMKMSRLAPRLQVIKEKYPNDPQKQNIAMQELYKEEGVSMGGGCLWSLLPLLIMLPLYTVVRQPMEYILHEGAAVISALFAEGGIFANLASDYNREIKAAMEIFQSPEQYRDALTALGANSATLSGLDFTFLGINLGMNPTFNIFKWDSYSWANIGAWLIPVLSAGSQVLSMLISQKMNNSLVTDEKGLHDKETAKKSQSNQTGKIMMWMMPLMSLWIGFTLPCALSLYWLVQGLVSVVIDVILTRKYRDVYDKEDAERLARALEREREEAEKERKRAERRESNPDGITQNTSKKKLQQQERRDEEAAKRAAAKEYAARKGQAAEEETAEKVVPSGIPSRPNCKGRAYDPNRYAAKDTEE